MKRSYKKERELTQALIEEHTDAVTLEEAWGVLTDLVQDIDDICKFGITIQTLLDQRVKATEREITRAYNSLAIAASEALDCKKAGRLRENSVPLISEFLLNPQGSPGTMSRVQNKG